MTINTYLLLDAPKSLTVDGMAFVNGDTLVLDIEHTDIDIKRYTDAGLVLWDPRQRDKWTRPRHAAFSGPGVVWLLVVCVTMGFAAGLLVAHFIM